MPGPQVDSYPVPASGVAIPATWGAAVKNDIDTLWASAGAPATVTATHSDKGETSGITSSDGYTITLGYDYAGRPVKIKSVVGGVTTYQRIYRDTIGRVVKVVTL